MSSSRALGLALICLCASSAKAGDVTLNWTGKLGTIPFDDPDALFHGITVGAQATGNITYDDAPCAAGCSGLGDRSIYLFEDYSGSFEMGGRSLNHPVPDAETISTLAVTIANDVPLEPDVADVFSELIGSMVAGGTPADLWLITSAQQRGFEGRDFGVGFLSFDTSLYPDSDYRPPPDPEAIDMAYFFTSEGVFLPIYVGVGLVAVPTRGDRDGEGIANARDNCPHAPNPEQTNRDPSPRGDACLCGDQSGDGRINVADLVAANIAIFNPALATPLCDANRDGRCDVSDIVAINVEIFSPGETAVCARQPCPDGQLTCP